MRMRNVILTLVLALSLGLTACEFGQVEQGRCVAFTISPPDIFKL